MPVNLNKLQLLDVSLLQFEDKRIVLSTMVQCLILKLIIFKTVVNKSIFVRCPDLASDNKVGHAHNSGSSRLLISFRL